MQAVHHEMFTLDEMFALGFEEDEEVPISGEVAISAAPETNDDDDIEIVPNPIAADGNPLIVTVSPFSLAQKDTGFNYYDVIGNFTVWNENIPHATCLAMADFLHINVYHPFDVVKSLIAQGSTIEHASALVVMALTHTPNS